MKTNAEKLPSPWVSAIPLAVLTGLLYVVIRAFGGEAINGGSQIALLSATSVCVMVGAGCFFILLLGLVWWLNRRDRLASKRWLLRTAVWSVPLAYLASQAGWVVAEVGRQPWAIQDLMPVGVAASKIPSGSVSVTFFLFLALFTALLAAELSIMFRQIKTGPKDD